MKTKIMRSLLKREWWEMRSSFLYNPMILGLLLILVAVSILLISLSTSWYPKELIIQSAPMVIYAVGFVFIIVLYFTIANYSWNCLYNDRKDNSVLFWQSMPVSQAQAITAKLIAALVIAPIVAWACLVITETILLFIAAVFSVLHSYSWQVFWLPGKIMLSWLGLLLVFFVQSIWLFPIVGWLLFCSAVAKRSPFLVAILPPAVVSTIEKMIWGHSYLFQYLFHNPYMFNIWNYFMRLMDRGHSHGLVFLHGQDINQGGLMPPPYGYIPILHYLIAGLIVTAVGLFFIVLATILRNRCYGFER